MVVMLPHTAPEVWTPKVWIPSSHETCKQQLQGEGTTRVVQRVSAYGR